ncbi:MAG: PaaI family thioesterase [Chloroflexota bacterium]|nr:PaaI family thioesterase [Chloroflexota bacterium]
MSDHPRKHQLTIEWDDPSNDIAAAMQMNGLDYMQSLLDRHMTPPPIALLMDFTMDSVADGYAMFKGTPSARHINPLGVVHGGLAATLLDSAMGCAVHTTLSAGKIYTTAQLNIHMTRTITPQVGELIAEGRVIHRGSRMVTAEATLKDAQGKLYAHGTTTCFVITLGDG